MVRSILAAAAIALSTVASAQARDVHVGALTVRDAAVAPTRGLMTTTMASATIVNAGKSADRLMSASCSCAKTVELHRMWMDGGIMRMRRADDGLSVPAGGSLVLNSHGDHLMLLDVKPLKAGARVRLTLRFEHAGAVTVDAPVESAPTAGMKMH